MGREVVQRTPRSELNSNWMKNYNMKPSIHRCVRDDEACVQSSWRTPSQERGRPRTAEQWWTVCRPLRAVKVNTFASH